MKRFSLKNNIIAQYTIVSFITTIAIAFILVLFMIDRVQTQFILSHGDYYKQYIDAIPSNYMEILPIFDVTETRSVEHSDHNYSDNWAHFQTDLMQYPSISTVSLWNKQGELVWEYPERQHSGKVSGFKEIKSENNSINFNIISKSPDFIISYLFPIKYIDDLIGIAEIRIENNNLKKDIEKSRRDFTLLIFAGGLIFYISLFLLFYKVYIDQKKAIEHLDQSQTLTIQTMSLLAELKDNDTGEHIQRTSEYCRIMAYSLRKDSDYSKYITDEYIKDLERSAPLHDIGKVGIPESILLKPGKLTVEEYNVIKKHTELGADVLLKATESLEFRSFFEIGYQIVLHHHENWDGSGYPHGLSGVEIPLSARIMAIADVYDALTTERPYKKAFSHQEAMEIIMKDRAKKFDPEIVDSFLNVESEFKFAHEKKRQ